MDRYGRGARTAAVPRMAVHVQGYHQNTYGARWVDKFTSISDACPDTDPCIGLLSKLAGPGPVVELGIGTGRIACALARSDVAVHGIDVSLPMLKALRQRNVAGITAWCADMSCFAAQLRYRLVYAVGNVFFMLRTAAEQEACLRSVRDVLADDGCFIMETIAPDIAEFTDGQLVRVESIRVDRVDLLLAQHDPDRQQIDYQRVTLIEGGPTRLRPLVYRYAAPDEIDAMATRAGLAVTDQWADWSGNVFSGGSRRVVRYQRVARP
jgi:SAM-dependent methyltransferase